jgi:hypothetical protein
MAAKHVNVHWHVQHCFEKSNTINYFENQELLQHKRKNVETCWNYKNISQIFKFFKKATSMKTVRKWRKYYENAITHICCY